MTEKKLNNCTQSQPTSDTRGKKKKKENVEKCFSWARRRPSCVYRYYDVAVTAAGFRHLKSNILQPLLRKIVPCSHIKPNHWKNRLRTCFLHRNSQSRPPLASHDTKVSAPRSQRASATATNTKAALHATNTQHTIKGFLRDFFLCSGVRST